MVVIDQVANSILLCN